MFCATWRTCCRCSYRVLWSGYLLLFIGALTGGGAREQVFSKEHRTSLAIQNTKDLWCYHCNTMEAGERCERLTDNRTDHHLKCKDEKMCMVKSISLTMSTGNSTGLPSLWLLERNCSKVCEPGCIVIGERTKLHACTKCCEADFCNSGRSPAPAMILGTTTRIQLLSFSIATTMSILFH